VGVYRQRATALIAAALSIGMPSRTFISVTHPDEMSLGDRQPSDDRIAGETR
jgi:hypothetical protein